MIFVLKFKLVYLNLQKRRDLLEEINYNRTLGGSLLDHDITSLSGKKVFLVIVSSDNGCLDIIEYPNMIVCSYNGLSLDQTTLLHPLLSLSILQVSIFT